MHRKRDAKRTITTEDRTSLIQAKQDRLVMAQQIRMRNTLKTITTPSPFMKNTGDDSQNCKINS